MTRSRVKRKVNSTGINAILWSEMQKLYICRQTFVKPQQTFVMTERVAKANYPDWPVAARSG